MAVDGGSQGPDVVGPGAAAAADDGDPEVHQGADPLGVYEYTMRELIREMPQVAAPGDKVVAEMVLGRLALKQHRERVALRKAKPKKPAKGLKSSAKTKTAPKRGADSARYEGLEPELAALASDLDM